MRMRPKVVKCKSMKLNLLILILAAGMHAATTAQARLGYTLEQCIALYGPVNLQDRWDLNRSISDEASASFSERYNVGQELGLVYNVYSKPFPNVVPRL